MASDQTDINEQKEVARYQVLVSAWVQQNTDRDKLLITLSAAGIGVLVALLSSTVLESIWQILYYALALLLFTSVIVLGLRVLVKNGKLIIVDIQKGSESPEFKELSEELTQLDVVVALLFNLAIAVSLVIGLTTAWSKFTSQPERNIEVARENNGGANGSADKEKLPFDRSLGELDQTTPPNSNEKPENGDGNKRD